MRPVGRKEINRTCLMYTCIHIYIYRYSYISYILQSMCVWGEICAFHLMECWYHTITCNTVYGFKDNVHHLSAALEVEKGRILSSGLLSGLGDVVGGILALILCQDWHGRWRNNPILNLRRICKARLLQSLFFYQQTARRGFHWNWDQQHWSLTFKTFYQIFT